MRSLARIYPYYYSTSNRGEALDFSGFTLNEGNPIVEFGSDTNLRQQQVFEIDENTWGMTYLVGGLGAEPGVRLGVKYATAPKSDPHNWTKVDTFLIESDTESWDVNIDGMDVIRLEDGSWVGLYTDWTSGKVGLATRAAGPFGAFTKSVSNPVIDNSGSGEWNEYLRHCCFIKEGDTYHLFYEAREGANDGSAVTARGIAHGTSADLVNWTLDDDYLLFSGDYPDTSWLHYENFWMPDVIKVGNIYFMAMLAHTNNTTGRLNGNGIILAKSTDLLTWTILNTQRCFLPLDGKAGSWEKYSKEEPSLYYLNNKVFLYYNAKDNDTNGYQIGVAELTAGVFDNSKAPLFSDDFTDGVISASKWNTSPQGGITLSETGGKLQLSADGSSQSLVEVLAGLTGFSSVNNVVWSAAFRYIRDTITGGDCQIGVWNADNSNGAFFSAGTTLKKITLNVVLGGVSVYSEEVDYTGGRFKIQKSGGKISFWESTGETWENITPEAAPASYYDADAWAEENVFFKILAANDTDAYAITIDDVVVLDFNSPLRSEYVISADAPSVEYEAILNRASIEGRDASAADQEGAQALIQAFKDAGVWDKVRQMKMFAKAGDSDFALIDWFNPGLASADAEKVNNPTFSADGFNSDGSTSALWSGLVVDNNLETNCTYLTKGFVNAAAGSRAIFGIADDATMGGTGGGIFLNPRNASDQMQFRLSNSGTATGIANTDATKHIAIARTGGTEYYSFNGAAFTANAMADSDVVNEEIALLAVRNTTDDSLYNFYTGGISYFIVFKEKLSNTELAAAYAALVTYLS